MPWGQAWLWVHVHTCPVPCQDPSHCFAPHNLLGSSFPSHPGLLGSMLGHWSLGKEKKVPIQALPPPSHLSLQVARDELDRVAVEFPDKWRTTQDAQTMLFIRTFRCCLSNSQEAFKADHIQFLKQFSF